MTDIILMSLTYLQHLKFIPNREKLNLYRKAHKTVIPAHNKHKKIATVTSVKPPVRFGELIIRNNLVTSFKEKPQLTDGWINGGFFVFENNFFKIINKEINVMLETQPLESLTKKKELIAFKHYGFWQCMDTLRDYHTLKKLNKFNAPWKK